MDSVRLIIYLAFLIRENVSGIYLSSSPIRATEGVSLSFTCTSSKSPLNFEKDSQPYCTILKEENGNCELDPDCSKDNTYTCSTGTNNYTLTILGPFMNSNLHKSKWKCFSLFGGGYSNEVVLEVNIPIKQVTINATPADKNPIGIVTGTNQTFKCITDAGRPSSSIQWYIYDTNITGSSTPQGEVCNSSCESTYISSSELLYTGKREDEGKNIYCTAINVENRMIRSQNRTVSILYGATNITISPPTQSYIVTEISGSVGPITCTADKCKPNCTITWNGPFLFSVNTSVLKLQNISRNQAGNYKCTASNIAWKTTSVTIDVIVEYGPDKVSISPSTQIYTVKEMNESVNQIICTADCRPQCQITWSGPNLPVDTSSILNLQNINRNQAGKYQCTAKNRVGNLTSVTVIIIVHYGPLQVNIFPLHHEYNVTESSGNIGPITCTADCKPDCTMTWKGPNIQYENTSVLNLQNIDRNKTGKYWCTASNFVGSRASDKVIVIVNYGPREVNISPLIEIYTVTEKTGSIGPINCTADCKPDCTMTWIGPRLPIDTTSILILQQIEKEQAGNYTCIAENYVGSMDSLSVRLVVHYGPDHVIISPNEKYYSVNETKSVIPISCKSDCKPICTMIWNGPNIPNNTSSVLNLNQIDRSQSGAYNCTASNDVGNMTSLSIIIIVNYSPDVSDIFGNRTYYENDTVTILCNVDSLPRANIRWIFENRILENDDLVSVNTNLLDSILNIRPVGCLSMGRYNCTAMNIIGQDTKAIDIDVMCSPRLNDLEYNVSTLIAVKDQEPLNITAPIIAFPVPYIYWTFVSNDSFANVTDKSTNVIINNRLFSHLYIENLTEADFGFYSVYAFNGIRKTEDYIHSFEVIPERKPNPPDNVSCIGRPDSVLVHWKSNFDGGDTQKFQIYIQKDGDASFYNHGHTYSDPGHNIYSEVTINQLTSGTIYHFKVRASNKHNYSMSEPASCNTSYAVRDDQRSTNTLAIGAGTGIGAAIFLLVGFAVVFLLIRRRKKDDKLEQDKELIKRSEKETSEEEDDELKDNPLYVTSDIKSGAENGAVYSTVDKTNKKGLEDAANFRVGDQGPVYSEVKTGGKKAPPVDKQDESGKKMAKKGKKEKHTRDIEMGNVYSNTKGILHDDNEEEVYANAENKSESKKSIGNMYIPRKNKDGLIYADLDIDPSPSGKKFVIRGLENRTNYAIIDLNIKVDPLPSDDDDDGDEDKKTDHKDGVE